MSDLQKIENHPPGILQIGLVLSCIDYRFVNKTNAFLKKEYKYVQFDTFNLAGSSLGYNKNAHWRRTFLHHIKLAIELHNITKIIIIDHENCGAYKLYKNEYENEYEYEYHCINIKKCAKSLIKLFPNISVECYYLNSNDESINIFSS